MAKQGKAKITTKRISDEALMNGRKIQKVNLCAL